MWVRGVRGLGLNCHRQLKENLLQIWSNAGQQRAAVTLPSACPTPHATFLYAASSLPGTVRIFGVVCHLLVVHGCSMNQHPRTLLTTTMDMATGVVHGCSSGPIVALVTTDGLFYGNATAVLRSDESKRLALYPPGPLGPSTPHAHSHSYESELVKFQEPLGPRLPPSLANTATSFRGVNSCHPQLIQAIAVGAIRFFCVRLGEKEFLVTTISPT